VRPEESFEPPGERVGHTGIGRVRAGQRREDGFGEVGRCERGSKRLDTLLDAAVERQCGDGRLASARRRRECDRPRLKLRVEHCTVLDLIPVVVLGVHPEHGHCWRAVLRCRLARELKSRNRLEQSVKRSAECSRLLTGDDGDGLLGRKSGSSVARGLRRASPFLLCRDDVSNPVMRAPVPARALDGIAPGRRRRGIARIQGGDRGKVVGVGAGEWAEAAETSHVHAEARRIRLRCHVFVLCQSLRKHVNMCYIFLTRRPQEFRR